MLPMTPTPEQQELRRKLAAAEPRGELLRRLPSRYLTDGTGRVVKIGGRP